MMVAFAAVLEAVGAHGLTTLGKLVSAIAVMPEILSLLKKVCHSMCVEILCDRID